MTAAGYALEWLAFSLFLVVSLGRTTERQLSHRLEALALAVLTFSAGALFALVNHPSGPDVGYYAEALVGFAHSPLNFYADFAAYVYPPLQLYFSLIPYLLGLPAFDSLFLVSILANAVSGVLVCRALGGRTRGLVGAGLLLFNPFFAQYSLVNLTSEALIAPPFLAGLYFLGKRDALSGALLGVSALAKQQVLYPILALAVSRIRGSRAKFTKLVGSTAVAFVALSLPFLVSTPAVYLWDLFWKPFELQSLNPAEAGGAAAFSTFWSVLNWASVSTGIDFNLAQAARPFVWLLLVALVVCVAATGDVRPSYMSLVAYLPYLLGSDFNGGWYLVVVIPVLTLVYLDASLDKYTRGTSLAILLSMLLYRVADGYSLMTGKSPQYVVADLLTGAASVAFVVVVVANLSMRRRTRSVAHDV